MSDHELYLYDLGLILRERALEAVAERDAAPQGSEARLFQSGRVMAFNEVISIIQQQAQAFGIPLSDLRLDGVEPDRDLC